MRRASVAFITATALVAAGFAGPATAKTSVKKSSKRAKADCVLIDANITLLGSPLRICI